MSRTTSWKFLRSCATPNPAGLVPRLLRNVRGCPLGLLLSRSPRGAGPAVPAPPSGGGTGAASFSISRRVQTLLRTPLFDRHVALGARMVPFAGWEMPVQYEGVIPEHMAVRTDSGVFDVSHMGELEVEGPRAHELLQSTLSNDVGRLADGDAQYTLLTNEF